MLRLRKIRENQALSRLAQIVQRVNEEESQKERARAAMDQELEHFSRGYGQTPRPEHFALFGHYVDRLESEIRHADRRIAELRPALEEEQAHVREARKERRTVEILEERARERYEAERRKAERKSLEELNIMKQSLKAFEEESHDDTREKKPPAMDVSEEESQESGEDKPKDPVAEYLKEHGLDSAFRS